MTENNILPEDFDGTFKFTNSTDEDFTAKWGNIEYTFPALKTTPMIMPYSPLEIQNIRKKFARELAIKGWYGTDKFKKMNNINPGETPALYTDSDLEPFIQKCLLPLEVGSVKAKVLPKADTSFLKTDNKGKPVSKVLDQGDSLTQGSAEEFSE